jgi:glutathionyl-hydroquinone reductase
MGQLVDGKWTDVQHNTSSEGHFKRADSVFRNWGLRTARRGQRAAPGLRPSPGVTTCTRRMRVRGLIERFSIER